MPAPGSGERPRPRRGLGLGAAGALLRAAGALSAGDPAERKLRQRVRRQEVDSDALQTPSEESAKTAEQAPESLSRDAAASPRAESTSEVLNSKEACVNPAEKSLEVDDKCELANAEFLEFCLGGPAVALHVEVQNAEEGSKSVPEEKGTPALDREDEMELKITSDDDSASDDNADLEDMFDFDPARLAELVNKGAGLSELTDHLQDAYANAFEQRLDLQTVNEGAQDDDNNRISITATADICQLMTPDEVTPVASPTGTRGARVAESLADCAAKLTRGSQCTENLKRRSISIQQRPSVVHRRLSAVKAIESFGRQSLAAAENATVEEKTMIEAAVSDAVRRASLRHRRSVTMAAEVLEEAAEASNVPLDTWSEDQIDSKVELIQDAMDEAYKRHTRSIVSAVHNVVANGAEAEPASQDNEPNMVTAVQAKIAKAVSAAYERRTVQINSDTTWQPTGIDQSQWCQQQHWFGFQEYQGAQLGGYDMCHESQWDNGWQWREQKEWSQFGGQGHDQSWQLEWHQSHDPNVTSKISTHSFDNQVYPSGLCSPWRYGNA
eukprot:TRINITY_DN40931_c0_g1_i1.p1 TRINITY_DN40931_c0_g1~~TRINITY_DN40931_c0_g1_i1.p1  ORF type:complete len:563 (-),score=91.74 TRINITY_DN40931_c0_g1_i1:235-1896(-)